MARNVTDLALFLDALAVKPPPASEWHSGARSGELRAVAAATWFLATDECSRQVLTCLPGGDTALDNATFVTAINCIALGGACGAAPRGSGGRGRGRRRGCA